MSKKQAKAFIKELHNDDALKSELKSTLGVVGTTIESKEGADEVIDQIVCFAAGYGHEFSVNEYKAVMAELKKQDGELSNDQLDEVSGGGFTRTWLP